MEIAENGKNSVRQMKRPLNRAVMTPPQAPSYMCVVDNVGHLAHLTKVASRRGVREANGVASHSGVDLKDNDL